MAKNEDPKSVVVEGRFCGGGLFAPKKAGAGFSANIVFDGKSEGDKIRKAVKFALDEFFEGKKPGKLVDWTVRKGDDPEFKHSFEKEFINAKSDSSVPVGFTKDNEFNLVTAEDNIVYPGCYVKANVQVYVYKSGDGDDGKFPAGTSLRLMGVCFLRDGEPMGTRFNAEVFAGTESEMGDEDANDVLFGG